MRLKIQYFLLLPMVKQVGIKGSERQWDLTKDV